MRSMILPGIRLGEGCVIAAGSVAVKDVPPYTIVGGNPAKPIKTRFPENIIKELLKLKIYDLPEPDVEKLQKQLCASDIQALKQAVKQLRAQTPSSKLSN